MFCHRLWSRGWCTCIANDVLLHLRAMQHVTHVLIHLCAVVPTSLDVIEISDEEGNSPPVMTNPGTNQDIIQVSDDEPICNSDDDNEHESLQPPVKKRKHKHYVPILPVQSPCKDKCIDDEITILKWSLLNRNAFHNVGKLTLLSVKFGTAVQMKKLIIYNFIQL